MASAIARTRSPVEVSMSCRSTTTIAFLALALSAPGLVAAQATVAPPVSRTDLMKQVLPPGDFRNVQASVVELAPGAAAVVHRHDVAVLAYVLEGEVENQFNGGPAQRHHVGESWWEAPGTVHNVARNASATARARLLIVYIGEDGKANTVPLTAVRDPAR